MDIFVMFFSSCHAVKYLAAFKTFRVIMYTMYLFHVSPHVLLNCKAFIAYFANKLEIILVSHMYFFVMFSCSFLTGECLIAIKTCHTTIFNGFKFLTNDFFRYLGSAMDL